jgi:hypothetical protein
MTLSIVPAWNNAQVMCLLDCLGAAALRMEHTFALKEVAASQCSLEGHKTTGKVLLIP